MSESSGLVVRLICDRCVFGFVRVDLVTGTLVNVRQLIAAVCAQSPNQFSLLKDWELLQKLNQLAKKLEQSANISTIATSNQKQAICQQLKEAEAFLRENLDPLALPFRVPTLQSIAIYYPLNFLPVTLDADGYSQSEFV